MQSFSRLLVVAAVVSLIGALWPAAARAVPSFARQTGMACGVCHIQFPELTPFGRAFKINGFTIATMPQIEVQEKVKESGGQPPDERTYLKINQSFPLSAMLQVSMTATQKSQSDTQNYDVAFPQQLSLFLAGEISPYVGSFLQVTYSGEDDHLSFDNTDIRYARRTQWLGKDTVYGLTLNNNPTVEDPWHSTPAWGFPWATSDTALTPAAGALVDGVLAQDVAGLGAYALWDNHLYGAVTVYRSAHIGSGPPDDTSEDTIKSVAPYWRLAWQQNWGKNYLEVGTFGLYARLYPEGVSGPTDDYTDAALDFQYERTLGNSDMLSLYGTYIYENQSLDASNDAGNAAKKTNHLNTFRLNGLYNVGKQLGFGLGYFLIRGGSDPLLYPSVEETGSRTGSPDSDGFVGQVNYYPWENVRLSLQYTAYLKFNGSRSDYDGAGRDAADNNSAYLLAWLVW